MTRKYGYELTQTRVRLNRGTTSAGYDLTCNRYEHSFQDSRFRALWQSIFRGCVIVCPRLEQCWYSLHLLWSDASTFYRWSRQVVSCATSSRELGNCWDGGTVTAGNFVSPTVHHLKENSVVVLSVSFNRRNPGPVV